MGEARGAERTPGHRSGATAPRRAAAAGGATNTARAARATWAPGRATWARAAPAYRCAAPLAPPFPADDQPTRPLAHSPTHPRARAAEPRSCTLAGGGDSYGFPAVHQLPPPPRNSNSIKKYPSSCQSRRA